MAETSEETLHGLCVLIVEDEYLIAADLTASLEALGVKVIGPAASIGEALNLVSGNDGRLHGAILDINLRGSRVFPVADALAERSVPFVFTTGYEQGVVPNSYADVPRCLKPVDKAQLIRWLIKWRIEEKLV